MQLVLELPDDPLLPLSKAGGDVSGFLRVELACGLYRQGHITLAQAARLAGMHVLEMGHEFSSHGISRQIGMEELQQDHDYVSTISRRE
jgi:predicted HTH domain antitoxin